MTNRCIAFGVILFGGSSGATMRRTLLAIGISGALVGFVRPCPGADVAFDFAGQPTNVPLTSLAITKPVPSSPSSGGGYDLTATIRLSDGSEFGVVSNPDLILSPFAGGADQKFIIDFSTPVRSLRGET
jgi:hypothetical protein